MSTTSWTRPLAVVTGASSGIGYELAAQFAQHGFDLIVAAEDDELEAATRRLAESDHAAVEAVRVDLSTADGVDALYERIIADERPVAALALNAGIGSSGRFIDTDLAQELELIDLNCRSTIHLAKRVAADMVARDEGRILLTSSIASTIPTAYEAVYGASKAFVQSFALGLRNELKDTGVTVTSLMPGPVDTEFWNRAHATESQLGASDSKDDPQSVAEMGFAAMMAGDERVIAASASSRVQGRLGRVLPDSLKAAIHARRARPGSAEASADRQPIKVEGHSVIDYGFAAAALTAASVPGLDRTARRVALGWGLSQGGLNALTDQPYAIRRAIPFAIHGRLESLAVPGLAAVVLRSRAYRQPAAGAYFGILLATLGIVYTLTDWDARPRS